MRLVVIGGVAAGLSAAARARRLDPSLEIVVLEKGDAISLGACGLPYYIEGQVGAVEDLILYTPERFQKERNIQVRTRARVSSIQHSRREVALEGGERVRYDRLVIATGARPGTSAIRGADLPHVFTLHTLDDARRLYDFLARERPRHATVVGAGYIGLEIAGALRARGLGVTVFEASSDALSRHDPQFTRLVADCLERFRIGLRLNAPVRAIEPNRVEDVPCQLVVLAAGLKPNVEMAAEAGVEIGQTGAIRVSERMETNLSGVYAAGDCAETTHLVTGRPVWLPLGTTANKMGRVAGASVAGASERFAGIVGTSIVRVCGEAFATTGLSAPDARREGFDPIVARIRAVDRPGYFWGAPITVELVADRSSRRLLGGTVVGSDSAAGRINVLATALAQRMRLDEFEQLDLAYAPPYSPVWDPLLIAAQQLAKQ
jgi:NADPH-dependent 2,4-dienoyl-CoA reductase/sulfur reductase-like enzyme